MKNIINNEQMISIADLKKQAKIARKQNNQLSNHSESLKAIAKEYSYDSWEKLLDSSYLMINQQKPSFQTGQKEQIHWQYDELLPYLSRFTNVMNSCHDEYEFLNNTSGYNTLFNFFQVNVLNAHLVTSPVYQKIKLLIDFMISSFIEYNQEQKEFKNILNFAALSKENPYFKTDLSVNSSDKLRKYMKLNNLHIYGFSDNQELQIADALQIADFKNHNEIILIINSLQEKIKIMATAYDVIEHNKKDNKFLNTWLSDYEKIISLSVYDEWVEKDLQRYQRVVKGYSSSFFDIEKHTKALEYVTYYKTDRYRKIVIEGAKNEVIDKINTLSEYNKGCDLNIEKAHTEMIGDRSDYPELQKYEFIFYYIIH